MTIRSKAGARWQAASILALAAAACRESGAPGAGGGDGGPDGRGAGVDGAAASAAFVPVEGTRIKARWVEGPGGQRTFFDWYDTQLAIRCSFRKAADGALRCLPTGYFLPATLTDFADAACTAPVAVYTQPTCSPHPFVIRPDRSNPCEARDRVYQRGERIADGQLFWRPTADECIAGGIMPTEAVHRVGPEVPASMFVRAEEVVRAADNPAAELSLLMIEAEDGLRSHVGWQNIAAASQCRFWRFGDGRLRCVPFAGSTAVNYFADATCSAPAVFYRPDCAPPPRYTVDYVKDVCPRVFQAFSVDARLEAVFTGGDGTCRQASPPPAGNQFHVRGVPVASESFPPIDHLVDPQATDRLRRRALVSPAGQRVMTSDWFDAARQDSCILWSFGGGQYRCAPANAVALDGHFADPGCTQRLWRGQRGDCPPRHAYDWDDTVCPNRVTMYDVGPVVHGPTFVRTRVRGPDRGWFECRSNTPRPDDVFHLVSAIPETEFAEVKLIPVK